MDVLRRLAISENWDAAERKVAMASDSSGCIGCENKALHHGLLNGSDMPPRDSTVEAGLSRYRKLFKMAQPDHQHG
jgi:exo-1,4-beta-D-glucosaminidase